MGGGVAWALGAKIKSGFAAIANLTQLEQAMTESDLVITGEGCLDHQSPQGKVVGGVLELAKKINKPVIIIAGQCQLSQAVLPSVLRVFSLVGPDIPLEKALQHPQTALKKRLVQVKQHLAQGQN